MSAHWLFILNFVRSAECIWWFSGFGVQLVGMWSGIDGMPNLISLKWTSDRSLIGSPILNQINPPCNHECRGCTRGGSWRTSGNEVERGGRDGGFLHRICPFEFGKLFHLWHTWLVWYEWWKWLWRLNEVDDENEQNCVETPVENVDGDIPMTDEWVNFTYEVIR